MTKILIDSSVYLSIFLTDSEFKQAKELIDPYLDDPGCIIYLPTIVIAEVINVLTKNNYKEEDIKNFIYETVGSNKFIIINPNTLFYFKKIKHYSFGAKLKTSDLIIYSIAKIHNLDKILTIDKQLSNAKL